MDKFKSVLFILLIYGLINIVLWGGQELYWAKDTKEISKIEGYLESETNQIASLKSQVDIQSSMIDKKEKELKELESAKQFNKYNDEVDNYNLLLQKYKASLDSYNNNITKYNNQVNQVNELIKKSSSRWYLIPIPIPSKSMKTKL